MIIKMTPKDRGASHSTVIIDDPIIRETTNGMKIVFGPAAKAMNPDREITQGRAEAKQTLKAQAWHEFNKVLLERKKLSSESYDLVEDGATNATIMEHYHKIKGYQPVLANLFDVARHVEQYGSVPEEKKEDERPADIYSLKDQLRKLIDQRCKLNSKIKRGHKSQAKVIEWQLELDIANAQYQEVDGKLKTLQGKK